MFYVNYDKGSLGNILYFLNELCGQHVAGYVMIDFKNNSINLHSKHFARFTYDPEGFPLFEFSNNIYGEQWVNEKRERAIKDWHIYGPPSKQQK